MEGLIILSLPIFGLIMRRIINLFKNEKETMINILIKKNREKYHVEYSNIKLSNHLVSGLVALKKLGATDFRLNEFYEHYTKRLDKKQEHKTTISNPFLGEYMGKDVYFPDYLDFFIKEINNKGTKKTINEHFPNAMDGLSSEAFHCMILIGYGLLSGEKYAPAEGLSYLYTNYYSLGQIKNPKSTSIMELYEKIKTHEFPEVDPKKNFQENFQEIAKNEFEFDLIPTNNTLDELFDFSLKVFSLTGCHYFFLLHGVTSLNALRAILEILENEMIKKVALSHYWRALVLTYVVCGKPELKQDIDYKKCTGSWDDVINKALSMNEEHIIKLVQVCHERMTQKGDDNGFLFYTAYNTVNLIKWKF
jgi:hypothetical protein